VAPRRQVVALPSPIAQPLRLPLPLPAAGFQLVQALVGTPSAF
jgi:hypothetical protein